MADTACKKFIMEVVHETWYKELEDTDSFYTNVTALKLIENLTKFCSGLHTVDAINIPQLTKTLFTDANGITQFINAMEAEQQKSKREKLVTQDDYMHAVALKSLLQSGEYKTETREWSKLPDDQQIWTAWKATFREAYVVKRRDEAFQEGEEKPFCGSAVIGDSAVKEKNGKLQRRGNTASAGLSPLTNQILESLEGYLENIAAATAKTISKGGSVAELTASLEIPVDTVARQQQEIKRLYEKIKYTKKRGIKASRISTMAGVGLVGTVCTHCKAVGRTAPHRKNACYFDPRKMTYQKEWDRKLMDEKGVACKHDECWWGTAQTVIHRYTLKEPLLYEASLSYSPTLTYISTPYSPQGQILPQQDTGIVDSGATHPHIDPSTPHDITGTSAATISVGTENGQVEKSSSALYY